MVSFNNLMSTLELPLALQSSLRAWYSRNPRVNREMAVLLPLMLQFVTVYSMMNANSNNVDWLKKLYAWGEHK